jgi:hypothetical protein
MREPVTTFCRPPDSPMRCSRACSNACSASCSDSQVGFFATELIRLAGCGTGAVQRELARLAASGLVSVTRVGNQKHYCANSDSPIFNELHGLLITTWKVSSFAGRQSLCLSGVGHLSLQNR